MVAVLFDYRNRVCDWSGCESVLELPVFSETLLTQIYKTISRLTFEQLFLFSQKHVKTINNDKITIVDNINEISVKPDEKIVVFFSDIYIDIDEVFVSVLTENNGDFKIKAQNGDIICVVLTYESLCEINFNNASNVDKIFNFIDSEAVYSGYSKNIKKPLEYKDFLIDILNKKTTIFLPEIAEGIFAEENLPQGDFSIIPPVYFDKEVQVESGSVIGPQTIVMSQTLISKDTNIKNSVLSEGCFVSSGCFVDGTIMFENASVRRNSILLKDSVLGHNCFVGEESLIENGSFIKPFTRVDDFKKAYVNFKRETNQSPAGFYGYTPEKAALLGAALGKVFDQPKIAVASDGELNSTALKLALLSGLMTTGASCFDFGNSFFASMHYFMDFCELDCGAFVSGNNTGTVITVFEKGFCSLTTAQYHNIKSVMTSDIIKRCKSDECKNIRQIHGMPRMYIQNLIKDFSSEIDFMPVFICDNKRIQNIVDIAISKIGYYPEKNRHVFNINYDGTRVSAEYDNIVYPHNKLLEVVSYYISENIYSLNLCRNDSVFLCFTLLKILHNNHLSLKSAVKSLPLFYVAESTLPCEVNITTVLNQIGEKGNVELKNGDICLNNGENRLKIIKNRNGQLRVTAKSKSMETARELVGELIEKLL